MSKEVMQQALDALEELKGQSLYGGDQIDVFYEIKALREALAAPQPAQPRAVAHECPKGCGCWWRDNMDGTMSLFDGSQKSCDACEKMTLAQLWPVSLADNLFVEQRGNDHVWLVCVEKTFQSREAALATCKKWQSLTPQPAQPEQEASKDLFMAGYAAAEEDAKVCHKPPFGWHCTRVASHDGPCAAIANDDEEVVARGMEKIKAALSKSAQPAQPNFEQEIAEILSRSGLTLLKTEKGYDVRNLGNLGKVIAPDIKDKS